MSMASDSNSVLLASPVAKLHYASNASFVSDMSMARAGMRLHPDIYDEYQYSLTYKLAGTPWGISKLLGGL